MSTVEKKIDKLGRIVLPIEFREKIGLENDSKALVSLSEGCICVFSKDVRCALCNEKIKNFAGIRLCKACIEQVKKL